MIFASLFVSILAIRRRSHPPVTDPAEEAADVVDAAVVRVAGETKTLKLKADVAADEDAPARDDDKDPAETA
ncbi:MAG: glycosyltransferase family 2 protein, partial [Pseudonocardiales bacterium]|nr:glycosyltransferase family 2 protein [Pseudonocardiales bacterium]